MVSKKYFGLAAISALLIFFIAAGSGCSRYAPTTVAQPKINTMDITLKTAAPIADNFYYYIVFDTSNPLSEQGPLPNLSGAERGKNWSYYILLYNRVFSEKIITTPQSIDDQPVLFDFNSPRYYQANFSSDTIHLLLNLDPITTSGSPVAINFITSDTPLTPTMDYIPALDYLVEPRVAFTPLSGYIITDAMFQSSSNHTVSDRRYLPADIIHWTVEIYGR